MLEEKFTDHDIDSMLFILEVIAGDHHPFANFSIIRAENKESFECIVNGFVENICRGPESEKIMFFMQIKLFGEPEYEV